MATLTALYDSILEGKLEQGIEITSQAISEGTEPQLIINNYMIKAMEEIGQRFQDGKAFVPELLMAARAMKGSLELLKPLLKGEQSVQVGKIVIGTVKGDLHDIGKNLVASMFEGCGFEVINLGIDVSAEEFCEAIKREEPDILCLSALLTTTMIYMKEVIDLIEKEGLRNKVKIMIGGAPVNQVFADKIGADGYSTNANTAVLKAKELIAGANSSISSRYNMKEWILTILSSEQRIAIPIMTNSGIELIGKRVIDAVINGTVHYEAVRALSEKYPSAASTTIMDLTVEAEAFGCEINFSEKELPSVIGRLVSDRSSIEQLEIPSLDSKRIPQYLLANRLAAKNLNKPVLAGCIGPFSLAGRLYDMSEIMMAIYIEPETIRILLDKCTTFLLSYCKALKETGASGVVIAEPAAGLLSNEACKVFSSFYVKQIVEEVQSDHFAVILHNCGNTGHCTEAMVWTCAMGYHFGNKINMQEALAACPSDVLVMGNLDPVSLFKMDSAENMYAETKQLLEKAEAYGNFVLSSGCDTPSHIPLENIEAFYKALDDYNSRHSSI